MILQATPKLNLFRSHFQSCPTAKQISCMPLLASPMVMGLCKAWLHRVADDASSTLRVASLASPYCAGQERPRSGSRGPAKSPKGACQSQQSTAVACRARGVVGFTSELGLRVWKHMAVYCCSPVSQLVLHTPAC